MRTVGSGIKRGCFVQPAEGGINRLVVHDNCVFESELGLFQQRLFSVTTRPKREIVLALVQLVRTLVVDHLIEKLHCCVTQRKQSSAVRVGVASSGHPALLHAECCVHQLCTRCRAIICDRYASVVCYGGWYFVISVS